MSDELQINPDMNRPDGVNRSDDTLETAEEFEEITSDEVDRVVGQLEQLMESVDSENVRFYLDEALTGIYCLIYEDDAETDEDAETEEGESLSDAA